MAWEFRVTDGAVFTMFVHRHYVEPTTIICMVVPSTSHEIALVGRPVQNEMLGPVSDTTTNVQCVY